MKSPVHSYNWNQHSSEMDDGISSLSGDSLSYASYVDGMAIDQLPGLAEEDARRARAMLRENDLDVEHDAVDALLSMHDT
jgi:hypothetical protein